MTVKQVIVSPGGTRIYLQGAKLRSIDTKNPLALTLSIGEWRATDASLIAAQQLDAYLVDGKQFAGDLGVIVINNGELFDRSGVWHLQISLPPTATTPSHTWAYSFSVPQP